MVSMLVCELLSSMTSKEFFPLIILTSYVWNEFVVVYKSAAGDEERASVLCRASGFLLEY